MYMHMQTPTERVRTSFIGHLFHYYAGRRPVNQPSHQCYIASIFLDEIWMGLIRSE